MNERVKIRIVSDGISEEQHYKSAIARWECFQVLVDKLSDLRNYSNNAVVGITKEGRFAVSADGDILEANRIFSDEYPNHEVIHFFVLGEVRYEAKWSKNEAPRSH